VKSTERGTGYQNQKLLSETDSGSQHIRWQR